MSLPTAREKGNSTWRRRCVDRGPTGALADVPRIVHYSASEVFTKYEICQLYGKILNLPIAHITADAGK